MAATAIALHLKRNTTTTTTTNSNLIRNSNSIKLFSSSSSFPQPPTNDNDETTPSADPQSQSQPSFTSYFKDLKSSLKQTSQQSQQPRIPLQQTQQNPFQRSQQTQSQFQRPQAPPTKSASFDEIRKNLAEFRNRTAAPMPSGVQNAQFPSASPARSSGISFQELYNKNVAARGDGSSNAESRGVGKMSYDMIRESIKELKKNRPVEVNKGNEMGNRSKLTDSLFGPASPPVYGGTGVLPAKVFGKEGSKKKEGESEEMKTKFLRMYTYGDLGNKLKKLRPEEAKEKKGKWFSLKELSERLIKLREVEEKESEADPRAYRDIRESLEKLTMDEKRKSTGKVYSLSHMSMILSFLDLNEPMIFPNCLMPIFKFALLS
ncbi:uncharacterized protein LOC108221958 isoform X2 [Daucus carota subsp. sativus]|uniref:uncharacterized protein LOC108221958 isoform X2 n=1 Tax=Daucus carota subsp. sativus TaxID=79200 RepID=UPI0030838EB4